MAEKTFYDILEVNSTATLRAIKATFGGRSAQFDNVSRIGSFLLVCVLSLAATCAFPANGPAANAKADARHAASVVPQPVPGEIVLVTSLLGPYLCPVSPLKNIATIPGVTADENTFARDQDSTGWCSNFALIDLICQALQQKTGQAIPKCSAADLAINPRPYSQLVEPAGHLPIERLILQDNLGFERRLEYVKENGICPEDIFPSEFFPNGSKKSKYSAALEKFSSALLANRLSEAHAALAGFCPECAKILPNERALFDLKSQLEKELSQGQFIDIAMLKKINDMVCAGKRVGAGVDLKIVRYQGQGMEEVNKRIVSGNPVLVKFEMVHYLKENIKRDVYFRSIDTSHSALIIGAMLINNKCFFVIKNSYGNDCSVFDPKHSFFKCSGSNGLLAIEAVVFQQAEFAWLE